MFQTYRRIFTLLSRRDQRNFVVLIGLLLVSGAAEVAGIAVVIPLIAVITDPSVVEQNPLLSWGYRAGGFETVRGFLGALCLAVFLVVVASVTVRAATSYAIARFIRTVVLNLSLALFTTYLRHPYEWFLQRHSADLAKTLLSETKEVVDGSVGPAMRLIAEAITCGAIIVFLLRLEPLGALVATVVVGSAFALLYRQLRRMLERIGEARRIANGERFQISQEALGGIKDVKMLSLEETYIRRFYDPSARQARYQAVAQIAGELPRYALEALAFGGMLIVLFVLLSTSSQGLSYVLPVFGAFALAGLRLLPTIQIMFRSATQMRFVAPALDALMGELAKRAPPAPPPTGDPVALRREIALEGLRYSYPGAAAPSLRDVTLTIPARTSCGFVGPTGAGKTTVIDLLLGLLTPQEGRIVVDGVPIEDGNRRAWQRAIGYVQQSVHLVDDTIASNIAFGVARDRIDRAAVERAARQAALHDFIATLPDGYETRIGERGTRLSGGQRQRIGIARALYRDPDVLVLDEATSALDTVTERAVMEEVGLLGGTKTVIVITHRLSTVARCDQIVVMRDGRIEATGSYEALSDTEGTFTELLRVAG